MARCAQCLERNSGYLTSDAKSFCVSTPRTIPFAYRDKLKQEIDLLVDQGIITPITEPTEWCAPIVVAPNKGTDRIRMCVDLASLTSTSVGNVILLQHHKMQWRTSNNPRPNTSVFDALKGYHQCPFDEESRKLTTFIIPFGRYMYLRAPNGISSISEHYNRRMKPSRDSPISARSLMTSSHMMTKNTSMWSTCEQSSVGARTGSSP